MYSYNSSYTEAGPSRDEIMVDEDQVDDILADIQAIAWDAVNVRDAWDSAM